MFALVEGGAVKATAPDAAWLDHLGGGDVVEITGAALEAAEHGYRLEVVDGAVVVSLAGAKARLWEAAKARREAMERGGCATPLGRVDTDLDSVLRITGAVSAAQLALASDAPFALDWTMEDNSVVTHDAGAMIAMGTAAMLHVAAVHERGRELRDAIEAAETVEALAAIDIEAGWPGA